MYTKKKIAPPKSTGGGGYSFEDKVAAYFLLCMLSDEPPLRPENGLITKISFQNRVDGWLIDDLLLEINQNGQLSHCAISIKSSPQFTTKSAPSDFVDTIWQQHLDQNPIVFDPKIDFLAIATTTLSSTIRQGLSDLFKKIHANQNKLNDRINKPGFASQIERDQYQSFDCPLALVTKYGEQSKGSLLKSIVNFEFDFDAHISSKEKEAIRIGQSILESGTPTDAELLWISLQQVARELRPNSGAISKLEMLSKLRDKFIFKISPKYETDWKQLKDNSILELSNILDSIGGKLKLDRVEKVSTLDGVLSASSVCVVLGPSGSGKTVLAKSWFDTKYAKDLAIWIRAESLNEITFTNLGQNLNLKHPFSEVLGASMGKSVTLVVDGLDRLFSDESFSTLSSILRCVCSIHDFKILLTCQPEEWNRIKINLHDHNIDTTIWKLYSLQELDGKEFNDVLKQFPQLSGLSRKPELQSLLYRPKILDLIASKINDPQSINVGKWVGESDFVIWFWEKYITNDSEQIQRETILKRIATTQADNLDSIVDPNSLDQAYLEFIDKNLIKSRLIKRQGNGINFEHDSYGDWVRLQLLLEQLNQKRLVEFIKLRATSPLWNKAIRLCSVYLLEQFPDLNQWRETIKTFSNQGAEFDVVQDSFLEGVIFSANPSPILESLWPDLIDNNYDFFVRLLGRFLHVATIPNPSMLKVGKQLGQEYETEAATIHRIPYWPYWIPILKFIYNHKDEIIKHSPVHLAKITDAWLRILDWDGIPLRKEAADLAISNAENVLEEKRNGVMYSDDIDKPMFRAALAAYKEYPDRLKRLIDEASGRIIVPKPIKKDLEYSEETRKKLAFIGVGYSDGEMTKPWAKGPKIRPDDSFEDVCLNTDAIYPIIKNDPKYASEIILTLLINPPTIRSYRWNRDPFLDNLELSRSGEWYPPFYDKGPFSFFLRVHPQEGLDLIIEIVNFAAERWADKYKEEHKKPHTINIEIDTKVKKLYSSFGMYFWYRDYPPVPDILVTALISLEKWLYDLLDANESIEGHIEQILNKTNNVAFLGVLSAIGRKSPKLFLDTLKPLLSVFLFFIWEDDFQLQSDYWTITWSMRGDKAYEEAKKWYTMPHRGSTITNWAKYIFLNQIDLKDYFEKLHKKWSNELKTRQIDVDRKLGLETLLASFDKNNYRNEEKDGKKYWVFQPPKNLKEKIDKRLKSSEKKSLVINTPMNSSYFLEKGKNLTDEQADEIWKNTQKLSKLKPSILEKDKPDGIADAMSGNIALLCKFKFEWLKKDMPKYQWCLEYLVALITNPPARAQFDSEHSIAKFHWDCFAGTALPYFWAEQLESEVIRKCIALLAASYHYTAISSLSQTCFELRSKLGNNFSQLQHLIFNIAGAKWKHFEARYEEKRSFIFEDWLKKESETFAKGKIDSHIPKWSKNVIPYEDGLYKEQGQRRNKKRKNKPGLDTVLIKAAYQHLPLLKDAGSSSERNEWINFWKEALTHVLNGVGEQDKDFEELEGVPSDWDYWVINRIAILCVELEENENPETFWKPILELSGYAHYLVEHFIDDFFTYGPRLLRTENFLKIWHSMLNYGFSSPKWNFESKRYSTWTLGDLWWRLIGLDISKSNIQVEELKKILSRTEAYFDIWSEKCLSNHRCALKFIYFLSETLGEQFRIKGLISLDKAIDKLDSYHFWSYRSDSTEKSIASFLNLCWINYKVELKSNQSTFKAFKHLLSILVARQNVLAMELHEKLGK